MPKSAAIEKSKPTLAGWHARRRQINGKKARALRRIARGLKLKPETVHMAAGARGRTCVMGPCERRAYQEAKAIYRGDLTDPGSYVRGPEVLPTEPAPFKDRLVRSIKAQPDTLGGRVG